MYRIDENTLIDKSLITCAEYQLFIDEMRTQGKYFQPDHWSSFQFLAGQSQLPILGIRPSDAKAFCVWLTQRETGVWCYRIPTSAEAADYPLSPSGLSPLGYWTATSDSQVAFDWVGSVPVNPRAINIHNLNLNSTLSFDHEVGRYINRTVDHTLARGIVLDSNSAFDHALNRVRAFDHDLTIPINRAHNLTNDIDHYLARNRGIGHFSDLGSILDISRDLVRDLPYFLTRKLINPSNLSRTFALDIAYIIPSIRDLYLDLYTLQERIAGRSPAFEGLRLVKERNGSN